MAMLVVCAAAYVFAWVVSLFVLAALPDGSVVEPLFVLGIFGVGLPALAFAATRKVAPRVEGVARPALELAVTLLYLTVFSVAVLGWGLSSLRAHIAPGRGRELTILGLKLGTMCVVPALLFRALRSRAVPRSALVVRRDLAPVAIVLATALFAFQTIFGRGLRNVSELHPSAATLAWSIPAALLWLVLEAGLTEELLFRAVLQSRLAASLRTDAGAVFVAALLFGLAHAPGLYLRGGHVAEGMATPTITWAVAYTIAIVSPTGLLFGVLWWRTRSFVLVVLLHAWTDLLPNLAPFIRTWSR